MFPEKYKVDNMKDGFQSLGEGNVVMHVQEGVIRAANKVNPKSTPHNLKIFGADKYSYFSIIFTKNSPLIPTFREA